MKYRLSSNEIEFTNVNAYIGPSEQMQNIANKVAEKFALGKIYWCGNNDKKYIKCVFENDLAFEQDEEVCAFIKNMIE